MTSAIHNNNKSERWRSKLHSSRNSGMPQSSTWKLFVLRHRKWHSQVALNFVIICIFVYCISQRSLIFLLPARHLTNVSLQNVSTKISLEASISSPHNFSTLEARLIDQNLTRSLSKSRMMNNYNTSQAILTTMSTDTARDGEAQIQTLCSMPKLTPGGKDVYQLDHFQYKAKGANRPPACVNKSEFTMFAIDFDSYLIRLNQNNTFWKTSNCSYRSFSRIAHKPDFAFNEGKKIYMVTEEKTKISNDIDHIHILCKKQGERPITTYEDYLSHVPLKPSLESWLDTRPASETPENYPSILILGQDSSSHMNFRRYMPKAHDYLVNTMKALEFNGFNSLGAGTLWSVFPLLSGLNLNEINAQCHTSDESYFDKCPWIWKDLEKLGYRTGHCEEGFGSFDTPPFNGFSKQPFHYDFRGVFKKQAYVTTGHNVPYSQGCYGSRLTFDILLENSIKVAQTFAKVKKPFFHFTWSHALTHFVNAYSKFGEASMLRSLKHLYENQLLNNTVLIVISDHGMRYGPLRRNTRQGFLEERLPILYIYIPEVLRKRFPTAYKNMKGNVDKLTTAFDVYATMKDLVNLTNLEDDRLLQREKEGLDNRRDVSLFLPVSPRRSCDVIGFTFIYCACMNRTSVSTQNAFVKEAVAKIIANINHNLTFYPMCDQLELVKVTEVNELNAQVSLTDERARFGFGTSKQNDRTMYEIGFETKPGNGMFYAAINKNMDDGALEITDITRFSEYGHDADCMESRNLKLFCHCKK